MYSNYLKIRQKERLVIILEFYFKIYIIKKIERENMIITGELKNKIDKIWEIFWTGGITNPLSVIEQFTYLIFIKLLDDKQLRAERDAILLGIEPKKFFNEEQQNLRWSNFKEL